VGGEAVMVPLNSVDVEVVVVVEVVVGEEVVVVVTLPEGRLRTA
jgi:hypothetical protein